MNDCQGNFKKKCTCFELSGNVHSQGHSVLAGNWKCDFCREARRREMMET